MTASSRPSDATTLLLLVVGALVLLPLLLMGVGIGGMMGYGMMGGGMNGYGSMGGWWPIVGAVVPLGVLLALLGGGYVLLRRETERTATRDPALEELRMAYARGDLTDEEFEDRRETLEETE